MCGLSVFAASRDFSSCGSRASHGLWSSDSAVVATSLVALRDVAAGFTDQGRTCVPCLGRWILNHWTAREVQKGILKNNVYIIMCKAKSLGCAAEIATTL